MTLDLMWLIYEQVLPVMISNGIEDTPVNRQTYLIGVREAYKCQRPQQEGIVEALTTEICRLGDEIPI